jgi:hypothetical protein
VGVEEVFVQVAALSEPLVTVVAAEWLLSRVLPEVVHHVQVPAHYLIAARPQTRKRHLFPVFIANGLVQPEIFVFF